MNVGDLVDYAAEPWKQRRKSRLIGLEEVCAWGGRSVTAKNHEREYTRNEDTVCNCKGFSVNRRVFMLLVLLFSVLL